MSCGERKRPAYLRVDRPPIRAFDAERLEQLLLGAIQRVLSGFLVDQRGEEIRIAAVVIESRSGRVSHRLGQHESDTLSQTSDSDLTRQEGD